MWELSVLSVQFFYVSKTVLSDKSINKKENASYNAWYVKGV